MLSSLSQNASVFGANTLQSLIYHLTLRVFQRMAHAEISRPLGYRADLFGDLLVSCTKLPMHDVDLSHLRYNVVYPDPTLPCQPILVSKWNICRHISYPPQLCTPENVVPQFQAQSVKEMRKTGQMCRHECAVAVRCVHRLDVQNSGSRQVFMPG